MLLYSLKTLLWTATLAAAAAHSPATYYAPSSASPKTAHITFTNTRRLLFDVDGNQIDAYGSKVQYFNGSYYLYGNSFSTTGVAFGIKSYSSIDLEHWRYEGFLYDPVAADPICGPAPPGCGRPHIVYAEKTGEYVLWVNAGSEGYVVATTAGSPSGPFVFLDAKALIDPQFDGLQPSDFTVETVGSEAGVEGTTGTYLVFGALNFRDSRAGSVWPPIFQTMHLSPVTEDLRNTTRESWPVTSAANDLIDQEAESPDLFYREGWNYVAASNTCGYCNGSIGLMYRSRSVRGPWARQIIAGYSCDGQVEGVLPLTDPGTGETTYVWHSTSVPGGPRTGFGGHIFQPLRFNADGSVQDLDCAVDAKFEVSFAQGTATVASGAATRAVDATPADAVYSPVCDSDSFDLFQTWKASKSGTLKNVSVNIARSVQTVPLVLTVFKFDSYADFISPEFKWTTLGTASINSTSLAYTFDTATVAITSNATVRAGDLLGLAIAGQDFAPYCHLEYDAGGDATKVLYQRGAGQNSWRGLKGNKSPVYVRDAKGVKFYVNYV